MLEQLQTEKEALLQQLNDKENEITAEEKVLADAVASKQIVKEFLSNRVDASKITTATKNLIKAKLGL